MPNGTLRICQMAPFADANWYPLYMPTGTFCRCQLVPFAYANNCQLLPFCICQLVHFAHVTNFFSCRLRQGLFALQYNYTEFTHPSVYPSIDAALISVSARESQQCGCVSREDSDQTRHQLSLVTVLFFHLKKL